MTRSRQETDRIGEQPDADDLHSRLNAVDRLWWEGLPAIRSMKRSRHSELFSSEVNARDHLVQDR